MIAPSPLASLLTFVPLPRAWTSEAYDEETFRHLLTLERRRAHHASRQFLLVLVRLRPGGGRATGVPAGVAAALFRALRQAVREVDFVGWYREGRVVGAVLTQGSEPLVDVRRPIANRVAADIARRLPASTAERLQVRVITLRGDGR